jgi:hypothetical protein
VSDPTLVGELQLRDPTSDDADPAGPPLMRHARRRHDGSQPAALRQVRCSRSRRRVLQRRRCTLEGVNEFTGQLSVGDPHTPSSFLELVAALDLDRRHD